MAKETQDQTLLAEYLTHVRYEWNMLTKTRDCLKAKHDPVIKNALIESFCLHARNLIEFFRGNGRKDYIKAKDFVGGTYKARFVAATSGEIGTKLHAKLNQQVAHLTKERTSDPTKKIGTKDRETIFEALRKEQAKFESLIQATLLNQVTVGPADPSATNAIETASLSISRQKPAGTARLE